MDAKEWITGTHAGTVIDKGSFLHFQCHLCGQPAGRSAWLSLASEMVGCFQPSCLLSYRKLRLMDYARIVEGGEPPKLVLDKSGIGERIRHGAADLMALPEGFLTLDRGDSMYHRRARKYMEKRGLDVMEMVDRWGIGTTMEPGRWFGRIILPFRVQGSVVWYQGRDYLGTQSRWDNPPGVDKASMLYGREVIGGSGDLWVFEGAFNVLTMGETPSCATLGKDMTEEKAALISLHRGRVLVGYDEGAWIASLQAARMLHVAGCDAWAVPFSGGDANELGREATLELAGVAVRVNDETYTDLMARVELRNGKSYPGKSGRVVSLW